jgi:hypothetical protein
MRYTPNARFLIGDKTGQRSNPHILFNGCQLQDIRIDIASYGYAWEFFSQPI